MSIQQSEKVNVPEGMRAPVIDHIGKKIVITEKMRKAATDPSNEASDYVMSLRKCFPDYEITVRKSNKQKKAPHRITYDQMRKYIRCLRGAEAMLEQFENVREYSCSQSNPYKVVFEWFVRSFPDYGCVPEFDAEGYPIVEINNVGIRHKAKEVSESAKQEQANLSLVG